MVVVGYIGAMLATGVLELPPVLDVPLALTGWLLFAGLAVWALWRHRKYSTHDLVHALAHPWPLTAAFVLLVLIASYLAIAWRLPAACNGTSLSCFKGYEWSTAANLFYHTTPDGLREQISRVEYIQEIGVHLRSAAAFGLYSTCLAWAVASVLERPANKPA
jgi:hypothetical protein